MKIDNLFSDPAKAQSFVFNKEVAEVFDDMAERSIPGYRLQQYFISEYITRVIEKNNFQNIESTIIDMGTSTGETLVSISNQAKNNNISLNTSTCIAFDKSNEMLDLCRKKMSSFSGSWHRLHLIQADLIEDFINNNAKVKNEKNELRELLSDYHNNKIDCIILHFILQFIALEKRDLVLKEVWNLLKPNGVLFLGEKVSSSDKDTQVVWERMQYLFKRSRSYSDIQIISKQKALEGVLIPMDENKLHDTLRKLENSKVQIYYAQGEFQCYIIKKTSGLQNNL